MSLAAPRAARASHLLPDAGAVLALLKPITWFAPVWAFGCGLLSSGVALGDHVAASIAGLALAGPLLCATSQAINDWCDRGVDAINEPDRPIPSGRLPGRSGLAVAFGWGALSLAVATTLGPIVGALALLGTVLAIAYSAEPVRLKRNGWFGNAAVGLSYETLPWIAGAALLAGRLPPAPVFMLALLYGVGAHGIMTLNDFKSVEGDRRFGIRTLPVQLGEARACRVACGVMAGAQVLVALLLSVLGHDRAAVAIVVLVLAQAALMRRLLASPRAQAPAFNGTGTLLYVAGMMVAAFAVRP